MRAALALLAVSCLALAAHAAPPGKRTLGRKIFAVHATSFLPRDGVLRAGDRSAVQPAFQPTIHFALGKLVQDYGRARKRTAWRLRRYALITPLATLERQLVNVMPHDAFIVGDLRMPRDALLLMPADDPAPAPRGVRVVRYDARTETLRRAVARIIAEQGGWTFTARGPGLPSDPLRWEGRDVNDRRFFAPYLGDERVDFALHSESEWGVLHALVRSTLALRGDPPRPIWPGALRPYEGQYAELAARRKLIDFYLGRIDAKVAKLDLPRRARSSYERNRRQTLQWVSLIDAELRLRREHGVSFLSQPLSDRARQARYELRTRPEELWRQLTAMRARLPRIAEDPEYDVISDVVDSTLFASVPYRRAQARQLVADFIRFLPELSEVMTPAQQRRVAARLRAELDEWVELKREDPP